MDKQISIYVGCSLTQAPESFKANVEQCKAALKEQGYVVFDFIGLKNGTEADVYQWDIGHCVRDCDIFLAICDYPSLGLGCELMEATRLHKPVIAVAHSEAKITRLVLGMAEVEPNVQFARYDSWSDIVGLVNARKEDARPSAG